MTLWLYTLVTSPTVVMTPSLSELLGHLAEPLICIGSHLGSRQASLTTPTEDCLPEQLTPGADAWSSSSQQPARMQSITVTTEDAGSTVPISQDVVTTLCGDHDGCELRLKMTQWLDSDRPAAIGQEGGRLHYDAMSGRWQMSDVTGTDGDGIAEQIISVRASTSAWDVCYLTDGTYLQHVSTSDEPGLAVLFWSGYADVEHTCELTLID